MKKLQSILGCVNCKTTMQLIEQAAQEQSVDIELEKHIAVAQINRVVNTCLRNRS